MVTHDPADARRFADLTVLVADGVAAAPVPTAALFANPPAALRDYLGT
jgi:thiamine transport system ATP-binding protein